MKIIDVQQGTPEWLDQRVGRVTASEIDALITPGWKVKDLDTAGPTTYLYTKLAEAWCGSPENGGSTWAMENGHFAEPMARTGYEFEHGVKICQAGFLVSDDGRAGCSPDGLLGVTKEGREYVVGPDAHGIEIKSPQRTNAVRYALEGILPPAYELQVHFSMFVTGFDKWIFLSYSRQIPKFEITVPRDEAKMRKIAEALAAFYARFDSEWDRLSKIADSPQPNPFLKTQP